VTAENWKYGDILRRAVTMNPIQYQKVMYVRPSRKAPRTHFVGVQLTEPPAPAAGTWVNPPPVGAVRTILRLSLFEPDYE
jgi:hypothetical protein